MSYDKTILIAGVGGQGTLLASTIIGNAAVEVGLKVRISETFGMSQRGGSVVTHIRIGQGVFSPVTPLHTADLIIGFEPLEGYRNTLRYLKTGGTVILNSRAIYINAAGVSAYPAIEDVINTITKTRGDAYVINATELAAKAGDIIMMNMVMLGAAAHFLPFKTETLKNMISSTVKKQVEANLLAFDYGVKGMERSDSRNT